MSRVNNKFLWSILFSWIIIAGATHTGIKCDDSGFGQCRAAGFAPSKTKSAILNCGDTLLCWSMPFDASTPEDVCCQKKECESDGVLFLSTQNFTFPLSPLYLEHTAHDTLDKKILIPVFKHYQAKPSLSIYTLIQSFLC